MSLMGMGGRCATALRQARLLAARGHRVLLGCLPGSAAAERGRELGLTVFDDFEFRRGLRISSLVRDCRRLASRCDEHKIDVVHAHLSQESWVAGLGVRNARAKPRPAVIRSRGVVVPVKQHAFNRWLHNSLTDRVVVPSGVIARGLRALAGFDPEKVVLIPDGVDIERFHPRERAAGLAIRREFSIPEDAPLVVMVARLERVKGHAIFFQALAQLRAGGAVAPASCRQNSGATVSLPGLRALCACDERTPGAFDAAVRQARELGLDESLLAFTGMRKDVERIVAAADAVVLPSLGSEGSSRVALEAAASGVPIAASAVGCLPEVVEDGQTGLLVPPGEPQALAGALRTLLSNREYGRRLGAAARARAESLYDEKQMVQRLEEVYLGSLARRK